MLLKPVGFGLLLVFAVLNLVEAQRRTWKLESTAKPPGQRTGPKKPHQRPTAEPTQVPPAPRTPSTGRVHPAVVKPSQTLRDPLSVQSHQMLQGPVKKISWRFPEVPQLPTLPPVRFEMRQPAPPNSVAAECGESMVYVEVKQDLFETGQLLMPSALTLGGCGPSGQDVAVNVLVFESELQACNSALTMTEDELIYTFMLTYTPEVYPGTSITRTGGAMVSVECRYARKMNVSSSALMPAWMPYAATRVAEEELIFSLRLMTDDWKYERPSNQYFLGDLINVEASVMQFNHVPFRVFVDSCVATPVPDVNAVPQYSVIENHGCLVDAKVTGSSSRFIAQDQDDKLQFQLEAFMFMEDYGRNLFITCFLKVTSASSHSDAENKACSFTANRWRAAYGDDRVCDCCETSCSSRKGRDVSSEELQIGGSVSLGPILVTDVASADVVESSD